MNSLFQVQLVMVHVFPRLAMCQQRPKWDTWEAESRPSSHVVLFRCRVRSQPKLMLEATSGAEWCWSMSLTMVIVTSNEDTLGLAPGGSLIVELFRPFFRWSCHYSSEGHRSSIGDIMPFCLRRREHRFWIRWWEVSISWCVITF